MACWREPKATAPISRGSQARIHRRKFVFPPSLIWIASSFGRTDGRAPLNTQIDAGANDQRNANELRKRGNVMPYGDAEHDAPENARVFEGNHNAGLVLAKRLN